MKYCKRCLYPENHPLGIRFDDEGICSGCRVHEEKITLDWREREEKLKELLNSYKSPSGLNYDCIVPVSGAKDSYFIVHTLKNVYGMNPLLVTYNKHYNTHVGNRNFAHLKTIFNCDTLALIVQPQKVKKITKESLKKMGSIYWHVLAGQSVFPVQIAVRFKIPLIVWGAHQGVEEVGMFSHTDEVEMSRKYTKEHDLMGFEAEDLLVDSDLCENDIIQYVYPNDKEIEKVRGIYLSNYIPWDIKSQHEEMIKLYGYETASQQRTFDTYSDIDCVHYNGLHDYIKYLKYGYGAITDHVCREIRWARLTREEGIYLIQKYENIIPKDIKYFSEWIQMTEKEILQHIKSINPKNIFHTKSEEISLPKSCEFILTPSRDKSAIEDGYTLLEKAYSLE